MTNRFLKSLLPSALLAFHLTSPADDIDLFISTNNSSTTSVPNVLFIIDNTANWTTAFTNEISALSTTFSNMTENKFRVGILFSAETSSSDSNTKGGYVRAAIRLMDSTNKTKYKAMINAFDVGKDKGNSGVSSLAMAEAYYYFKGLAPYAGNNKAKTDYTGNTAADWSASATSAASKTAMQAIYALSGNALSSKSGTTYNSPVTDGCQKNYIIYVSNGAPQDSNSTKTTSNGLLSAAGGSTTTLTLSPSSQQDNPSDEWARFMKESSLGVVTYTVDVDPVSTGQGPGWTAVLKSMASVSGGKYFSVTSGSGGSNIAAALSSALSEIQSVNSVFASVSLPASVNTQGTFLNQVFIGMFRPDPDDLPRWPGNLKQYKLGYVNGTLKLVDAGDNAAINSSTGFITACARSFWTPSTADSYWAFKPQGTCPAPSGQASDYYMNSNYPDGYVVEKGAQAYKLRSTTSRTVYTCSPTFATCAATSTLTAFDTSNSAITYSLLGLTSSSGKDTLINWARGQDVLDENTTDGVTPSGTTTLTSTVVRPSVHGDVLHSRPVAINYGSDTSPSVVVFYGANDGMLHAINGNQTSSITSNGNTYAAGAELWSFVAPESYTVFKRLYDNSTQIKTASITTGTPTPLPKAYAFDGPITAYKDSSHAWIYATMRRGGRVLYAFDVTTPGNPTLKWKLGCPNNFPTSGTVDDTGCSTGFSGIGQTWSSPKTLKSSGYGSGTSPMLIMGGGYDTCEDSDPNSCTAAGYSTKGSHIYVLDADTGTQLTTLDTDRGVVGDVMVITDTTTGLAQYAYAADLGGNVYRITIGSAAPASWTITKIASLGCATTASCTANRKFMFGPDVVVENGTYIILLGSGDREKPLTDTYYPYAYGATNYFFMIKDKPSDSSWLSAESTTCGSSVICLNSLYGITTTTTPDQSAIDAKKGWYLGLSSHEQVVTSAITLYGTVTFSTHIPAVSVASACSSGLGTANVYNISYLNAAAVTSSGSSNTSRFQSVTGGGLSPSPVAGLVKLSSGNDGGDGGGGGGSSSGTVPFCLGCSPDSSLENGPTSTPSSSSLSQSKTRVYWYIQQ